MCGGGEVAYKRSLPLLRKSFANMLPLIEGYRERVVQRNARGGLYAALCAASNSWESGADSQENGVKLLFFGGDTGVIQVDPVNIPRVHEFFRGYSASGAMRGSVAINKRDLTHQHLVIDFDLKSIGAGVIDGDSPAMTAEEYRDFQGLRLTTVEKHVLEIDDGLWEGNVTLRANYFVYEVIFILTEVFRINWLPIYILGKAGTFSKGFHIEIPDLIMSFHDVDALSTALSNFMPNRKLYDYSQNYSVFGSQKNLEDSDKEVDLTYLPYCKYFEGTFCYEPEFGSYEAMYDKFNILKPIGPDQRIYGFPLHHLSKVYIESDRDFLLPDDCTIPEFERSRLRERETAAIRRWGLDEKLLVLVGYIIYHTVPDKRLSVHKYLRLDPERDYVKYGNLTTTYFNFGSLLPNSAGIHNMRAYMKKHQMKLLILETARYKVSQRCELNFTNKILPRKAFDSLSSVPDNGGGRDFFFFYRNSSSSSRNDEECYDSAFHPFQFEHVLDLCRQNERLRHTVLYLMAVFHLSETNCCDQTMAIWQRWMTHLTETNLAQQFLAIYGRLREKSESGHVTFKTTEQRWVILSLKILLLHNDVVRNKKSGTANQMDQFKYVESALRLIRIPDVVLWYLWNYYPYTTDDTDEFYRLMALYIPVISAERSQSVGDRNKKKKTSGGGGQDIYIWDSQRNVWRVAVGSGPAGGGGGGGAGSMTSICASVLEIYPELHHIFHTIIPWVLARRKKEEEEGEEVEIVDDGRSDGGGARNNNDDDQAEAAAPPAAKKKRNDGGKILTLNTVITRIMAFWSGLYPVPVPDLFFCLQDCWYILGMTTLQQRKLLAMQALPMYHVLSHSPVTADSYDIEETFNHISTCPFVQEQLYPAVRQILRDHNAQKLRNGDREERAAKALRDQVDKRTQFRTSFEDINTQIEMEVLANLSQGQARCSVPCGKMVSKEKEALRRLNRDEYHLLLSDVLWRHSGTRSIAKLVKAYVLAHAADSYQVMSNVLGQDESKEPLLAQYAQQTPSQRSASREDRIRRLSRAIKRNTSNHPEMAHKLAEDLGEEEFTPLACNCDLAHTFIYLLQTFSYDVISLRYVFGSILAAMCYGVELKTKRIHFLLGNTNCGKTQFLDVLLSALGHVIGMLSTHTAYHGTGQDRIHDLGKWCDTARMWVMDEVGQKPFNRQLINQITGNSPLFVRTNYSDGKMITVAPSVFIFGNNKPSFNENCPALMERLRFFTFRTEFRTAGPFSFKYCKLPQTPFDRRREISRGIVALLLHFTCSSQEESPFYLFDVVRAMDLPRNVIDSTAIYSPVVDIVRKICALCGVEEQERGMITLARFSHLISGLGILKLVNIASETDALQFVGKVYVKSRVPKVPGKFVTIFQGIAEIDIQANEAKIMDRASKS